MNTRYDAMKKDLFKCEKIDGNYPYKSIDTTSTTVTLTKEEYNKLLQDQKFLYSLRAQQNKNWKLVPIQNTRHHDDDFGGGVL